MSLWKIAWRSIQQRALASTLTGLSMALGVALVVAVLVVHGVVSRSFAKGAEGFDLIVGAKGSKLQLVLNTVYHLSAPVENVPWSFYKEFQPGGRFASQVHLAIPCCLGDNYEGFRVVGTVPALFETQYANGQAYTFSSGRNFKHDHFFEAVVGSVAARQTGLKVGSQFQPTHGVEGDEGHKHDAFSIVGVLAPTGTPNDRALFVNMEGFYLLEGHAREETTAQGKAAESAGKTDDHHDHDEDHKISQHEHGAKTGKEHEHADEHEHAKEHEKEHEHPAAADAKDHEHGKGHDHPGEPEHGQHAGEHEDHHDHDAAGHEHHAPLPESQREVTALLVRSANALTSQYLYRAVNKGQVAQAVYPIAEIRQLFDGIVGNLEWLLLALAGLIVVVAGIGVMVSIYNSMSDRRRDIAVMRALGAGRQTVLAIILVESILLALGGGAVGFVLGHVLLAVLSPMIVAHTGVSIGLFEFDRYELILVPALVVLASIVGYLPALAAYRTDVAKSLSDTP